jgi:hypothetical protein
MPTSRSKQPKKINNPQVFSLGETIANITNCKRRVAEHSYNAVFTECSNIVTRTARYGTDDFVIFQVPPFVMGCPVFDRTDCTLNVIKKLKKMGVSVEIITPYLLCICWNPRRNIHDIIATYKKDRGLVDTLDAAAATSHQPQSSGTLSATDASIKATLQKFEDRATAALKIIPPKDQHMQTLKHPPEALFRAMVSNSIK